MGNDKLGEKPSRTVTLGELLAVVLTVIVILVPLVLLLLFPDNELVARFLGGGRVMLVWAIVFGLAWLFRKNVDRFFLAIRSLLDPRTRAAGARTPNDIARLLNKGVTSDAGEGLIRIQQGTLEAIVNPVTKNIVTIKPVR